MILKDFCLNPKGIDEVSSNPVGKGNCNIVLEAIYIACGVLTLSSEKKTPIKVIDESVKRIWRPKDIYKYFIQKKKDILTLKKKIPNIIYYCVLFFFYNFTNNKIVIFYNYN